MKFEIPAAVTLESKLTIEISNFKFFCQIRHKVCNKLPALKKFFSFALMNQTEEEILQYEAQLAQIRLASAALSEGEEKEKLKELEADLNELISLSKSSLQEIKNDRLSEESNLFKANVEELDVATEKNSKSTDPQPTNNSETESCNLTEELDNLKGTKCQAPFTYKWTNDVTYYNAFITHVPNAEEINGYDNIYVRVMFTNPTHKEMLPCPYYLEGKCRFGDDKCRYSHGEMVLLSSLKEYREPDFSAICRDCKVLAKQDDGLWYRATVSNVTENHCLVKFESNSKEETIPFHNILPLDFNVSCDEHSKSSDEDVDIVVSAHQENDDDELVRRILSTPPTSALGEWEKYTKGFGSKIMEKMGYIYGSGLGKNGMGRVEPVPAVIFPAGKSLDHCMMLKEKAGNDQDLFKAERKLKHLQRKHEEKLRKAYEAEKEKTDIFTFLNSTLHPTKVSDTVKTKTIKEFKNETNRNLNVSSLQIAEELRKVEKEIKSLNQSLTRHSPHTHGYNIIKEKLLLKQQKLSELLMSEKKIVNEQNRRRDRQKLTEF